MPAGGKRDGAGRPRGVGNKKTVELQESVAASGITPLEYMLQCMRDESAAPIFRLDAAKSAAPYVHRKLANIEHTGEDGGPIEFVTIYEAE